MERQPVKTTVSGQTAMVQSPWTDASTVRHEGQAQSKLVGTTRDPQVQEQPLGKTAWQDLTMVNTASLGDPATTPRNPPETGKHVHIYAHNSTVRTSHQLEKNRGASKTNCHSATKRNEVWQRGCTSHT